MCTYLITEAPPTGLPCMLLGPGTAAVAKLLALQARGLCTCLRTRCCCGQPAPVLPFGDLSTAPAPAYMAQHTTARASQPGTVWVGGGQVGLAAQVKMVHWPALSGAVHMLVSCCNQVASYTAARGLELRSVW
jgi:hypothetical protein